MISERISDIPPQMTNLNDGYPHSNILFISFTHQKQEFTAKTLVV